MNILVTGANGQLGNEMRIVSASSEDRFIFSDIAPMHEDTAEMLKRIAGDGVCLETLPLDICDADAIRRTVKENSVQAIVNCAAYTNVEAAEDNFELAERLNATAPSLLARAMKDAGGLLIHISTDYVFGKEPYNTPCREDRTGTPTGVYGLTKLHGEEAVRATGCDSVIIRTAWLYSEFGKNFVKTMLDLTSSRPSVKVVFDQVGTPTYALDLASAIIEVLKDYGGAGNPSPYPKSGIYHFSNEGVCSWFDFTRMIYEYKGIGRLNACRILPCHSDEFPSKVTRPAYSVLDKTKFKEVFGMDIPYWTDSLKTCLNRMQGNTQTHQ